MFFSFIPFFLFFYSTNSFIINKPFCKTSIFKNTYKKENTFVLLQNKDSKKQERERRLQPCTINPKTKSFLKLIRYQNVAPTFLLSFTGGWLINPSLYQLFSNPYFIGSSLNTLLIMSSSMILNDIQDLKIDKINHPERPLVTGEIKIWEAYAFTALLLGSSQYINTIFLSESLRIITNLATIFIFIYTPILKRILLIKNISCASLVSFSIFFAGLSATNQPMVINKNFGIFSLVLTFVFLGSLYNEILLDISDYEGDKENKIRTIPVIIGKQKAWILSHFLLKFNILMNTFALMGQYNIYIGSVFYIISIPLLYRSIKIKKEGFTNKVITNTVSKTNMQLFVLLLYFCFLIFL
jgi:4-hydroxybenzoate polyprenyltransferase